VENEKNPNYLENEFIELSSFIIDEDFDIILENLKADYPNVIINFLSLYENQNLLEYLDYYKEPTEEKLNFLKSKYDYDICTTLDFGTIKYDWKLESNPYNIQDRAYILDSHTNPIKILNSNGSIDDTLILVASNQDDISTEYNFYISMKNWIDENGNAVVDETTTNSTSSTSTSDTNSSTTTDSTTDTTTDDPNDPTNIDWSFDLFTSSNYLNMLYGETQTVRFTISEDFDVMTEDILGVQNISTFTTSHIAKISDRTYEVNVTAKEIEGIGAFTFAIQNNYFATSSDVKIDVKKPISVYNLYNNYSVILGDTLKIQFNLVNPRGDDLSIKIANSSNLIFDAFPNEQTLLNVKDTNFTLEVKGLAEGENTLILQITDVSLSPNYSIEIPVKIIVSKSDSQLVEEELKTKESAIFTCRDATLNSSTYEYVSDIYDDNMSITYSPENLISVRSDNSAYQAVAPGYSTLLVLYPVGLTSDNVLDQTFNAFDHNTNQYIGQIKYSKIMSGQEFYLKYYDNASNTVICEKHRF
jgi:hypothetical protein